MKNTLKNNITKYKCMKCQSLNNMPILMAKKSSFTPQELENNKRLPKYNLAIKLMCGDCNSYIKFLEQTEENIEWANKVCSKSVNLVFLMANIKKMQDKEEKSKYGN